MDNSKKKKEDNKKAGIGCAIIVGIIIIISIFSGTGEKTTPVSWDKKDNSIVAYVMAEDFVTRSLKAPATAKFQGSVRGQIVRYEKNQYRITSYVDSQNSFGAMIRTPFVITVQQVDKDNWKLIDISI